MTCPPYRPHQDAPLSWHLSKEKIRILRDQWRAVCEGAEDTKTLRGLFPDQDQVQVQDQVQGQGQGNCTS